MTDWSSTVNEPLPYRRRSVSHIKGLPWLQQLWVSDTELTDQCIAELCEMDSLTVLDIRGTQISSEGVAKLKKHLPGCTIAD